MFRHTAREFYQNDLISVVSQKYFEYESTYYRFKGGHVIESTQNYGSYFWDTTLITI